MTKEDIVILRMFNQGLLDNLFETPADAVANFGAIQSQDYNMAVWALGLRIKNPKRTLIEKAINTGEIIRTHILRPTWHFVHQKDIRWMMELSASNVKKATQYVDKKEGLTNELFNKIWRIIELEFNKTENLTKENIKNCLFQRKIEVNNLLLTQVIIRAELEMRLCNGETKDHYTLFEKRIPSTTKIPREEAICKLAKTYFTSRGPATLKDFAWWSGLNMKDAKLGISGLGRDLCSFMLDNLCYYHFEIKNNFAPISKSILLPAYDEYMISYTEGRDVVFPAGIEKSLVGNGIFKPLVIINNEIKGTWNRIKKNPFLEIQLLTELGNLDENNIEVFINKWNQFTN